MDPIERDDYAKFKQEVPKGATLIVSINDTLNGVRLRYNQTIYEIPQAYLQDGILDSILVTRGRGNVSKSLASGKSFVSFMKLECAADDIDDNIEAGPAPGAGVVPSPAESVSPTVVNDKFCAVVPDATVRSYLKLNDDLLKAQGKNQDLLVATHIAELGKSDAEAAETMKQFITGVKSQNLSIALQEEAQRLLVNTGNFGYTWVWQEGVHERNDRVMKLVVKEKYGFSVPDWFMAKFGRYSNKNENRVFEMMYPAKIMQSLQNKPEGEREATQSDFLDNVEKLLLQVQANPLEDNAAGGLAVLLSAAATVTGDLMGWPMGQPRNANPLLAILTEGNVIFMNRLINDTVLPYSEGRQLDSALDMIVRKLHERLEPSPHVEYLDMSSSRSASASTGYEISPPSNNVRTPN